MITRTDVLAHLERGMRVGFLSGQKAYNPMRSAFVQETPSDGAFEIYGDMGAVPWPRQNGGQTGASTDARTGAAQAGGVHEGGPIVVLGGNERGLIVYNDDWQVPIGIWHNAINDNRIGGLEEWARNAGSRFDQHKDYLCFDALNQGESTSTPYGACYDGFSFFNDAHTDKGAEYQTTQDNRFALTLSRPNFTTVRVAAGKFRDDRGQPYGGPGHSLLVHALDLEFEASQITDNPEDYSTADRARNPYAGKITRLSAPGNWVDSTAWFAIDPTVKPIKLQNREAPQLVFWDDHSQGNGIRYYKWVARYKVFYGDWRGAAQGNS